MSAQTPDPVGSPIVPDPAHVVLDPVGFSAPSSGVDAPPDPRNLRRRAVGSWALYDLANTIWSYGIFSFAIGLYLTQPAVLGPAGGSLWLQIAIALSVGLNALVSPAIGAISDRAGRRMPYLLAFTVLAIVPAMLISLVRPPAPATVLASAVDQGATSISVGSTDGMPSSAFEVRVGGELMRVTAISGTTLTVTRASGSTKPDEHPSGAPVTPVIDPALVALAILLFCLANFGYGSALIYYDATLKLVSTSANRGWVSGVGNGLGYLGTILIGLIILFGGLTVQQVFVVAPALFAILAIPVFLLVKERAAPSPGVSHASIGATLRTIRALGEFPGLRRFLLARFFYTDAQNTVIAIMAVFAVQAVGFSESQANYVLVALATTAVVGGIVWGRLTDTRGPKATLRIVLTLWAIALVVGGVFISPIPFIIAGVVLGFGFGGLAGADRVLMYRLSPPERLGEFYGLYGLVGKGSQVIGGLLYGFTVALLFEPFGVLAYQIGILTLLVTMLIGMWLLRGVPERREG